MCDPWMTSLYVCLLGVGYPCPPVRNDIVTPRHLMLNALLQILSGLLIFTGVVMMIMQIVTMVVLDESKNGEATSARSSLHYEAGTGFWCGICIIIVGILGCGAAKIKTNVLVTFQSCAQSSYINSSVCLSETEL